MEMFKTSCFPAAIVASDGDTINLYYGAAVEYCIDARHAHDRRLHK